MTDEELLSSLKRLSDELGKDPTAVECNSCDYTANSSTYRTRFGSWVKAKELAGISTFNKFAEKTDKQLIESLQKFYEINGKAPTQRECRNSNGLFGPNTYKDSFGGWNAALERAGLTPNKIRSTQISDEQLLQDLRDFYNTTGRAPRHEDCNDIKSSMKSHMVYKRRFGTFTEALLLAGVPLNDPSSSGAESDLFTEISKLYQGTIIRNARVLNNTDIDIYLPELNLGIEFDGLYWHSDTHKDKHYHYNKTKVASEKGIRLIHVFESEWLHKRDIVLKRLNSILGNNKTIYARKCAVKEITSKESEDFIVRHHIQGNVNASVRLGLFHNNILVAVETFCKSRFSKDCEWELLRYCSEGNVVGGASKLFSYFIKHYTPLSIVTYSDLRWNTGGLYYKLGFTLSHVSEPNYYYFKGRKLESRNKYQKHKLQGILPKFDESLSEVENMKSNGFNRIFDCGNLVFKMIL